MNHHQNNRRAFIAGMAILSAGAALESFAGLIPPVGQDDLKTQWKSFWRENNGLVPGLPPTFNHSKIPPCAGHVHRLGEVVYFPGEDLFVQPTWIYWGRQKTIPADLVVSFYANDEKKSLLCRINRFELEGFNALKKNDPALGVPELLKAWAQSPGEIKNDSRLFRISTMIDRKQRARSVATLATHEVVFQKHLFYNA